MIQGFQSASVAGMASLLPPHISGFLLQSIVSGSFHLISLILLFFSWVYRKCSNVGHERRPPGRSGFRFFRLSLFCCLAISFLNLCLSSYFYWYTNGWSDEHIATFSDLVLRTMAWIAISIYLHTHFSVSSQPRFPFLLRILWGFFFFMSCYFLVVDAVLEKKEQPLPIQVLVSDVVSTILGLTLCFLGFLGKNEIEKDTVLQEPLLNGGGSNLPEKPLVGLFAPCSNASLFSSLTFSWMGTLVSTGYKKQLDLDDVPPLTGVDTVKGAFPIFKNGLDSSTSGSEGTKVTSMKLVKALIGTTSREIVVTALLALVNTLASYVGPYLIDTFVQYLNGHRDFNKEGYVLVSAFLIAKIAECLAQRHWFFILQQAEIRINSVLVAMIYNKGLTKQGHNSGEMINFVTVDAGRIGFFSWYMHTPWIVILQIALALLILYKNLGLASVAALVATILVMLANFPIGNLQEKFQDNLMKSKDNRMKATSEILRNMRILKLQAWEMNFLSKIVDLRKTETGWLKRFVYTTALSTFVFWGAPAFVSVVTFGACMVLGIPLESGKILSALATFKLLQEPIDNLPDTISTVIQTKVSLDRIASFLSLDDLQSDVVEKLPFDSSDIAFEISNGNFSWNVSSSANPSLKDINICAYHGMKVAVCGTVGSGKSSLLSCILGELPKLSGSIRICGTKAYVPQSPWVQSGTIEDNILFGKEMERERYEKVLEACSLKKDLEILSFGDQTVIGERGINLSGGQKQRIQIARALYQDADIYLLDDPFSAVDAHTGTHLFKECLLGILGSKTVIYVTHQVGFLPAADLIMVMKDGRVTQSGKYNDILGSGGDFMALVGADKEALSAMNTVVAGSVTETSSKSEEDCGGDIQNDKIDDDGAAQKEQIVQEEERKQGKVVFSVYWKYVTTAYGGALVPFILLAHILFEVLQIGSNYWMASATPVSKDMAPPVESSKLILVYIALAIGGSFCILIRALLLVTSGFKTATILFNKMHSCIFRAPMSFFDSTPSGRILTRASTDQSAVDLSIPSQVGAFAFSIIQLLGIIVVMSQVAWQVFIVFIPVIAISIWSQRYYIASARELTRLIGVCKAPVIQHVAETISGCTTIRSFDQESRFRELSMKLIDDSARPKFYGAGAREWLCFRLDMLSSLTFAISLVFLISVPPGTIDPSVSGVAVIYGLNLNMIQAMFIWHLCTIENKIISVERILGYTSIPSEPPLVVEEKRPDVQWPSQGKIDIQSLQVRYAPHMPMVLRGLTCTFHGGMRTGIVGRTGSGKSTLIQTLFRLVDPAAGQILIDGINISSIGLHDLRSRLSIIPQDPTMFEGTVRSNLDPLEEYTDEQIWEALDKCQLGEEVRKKDGKLDSAVTENGENWSMGQRQLVCLGRVLLKKSKVLVLDEATASVDTATDNLIQKTLNQHFSSCTVLTIAHRITSVLDSDMVLLLEHGVIKEYDTPEKLLEDKSSLFSKLVAEYSTRSNSSLD